MQDARYPLDYQISKDHGLCLQLSDPCLCSKTRRQYMRPPPADVKPKADRPLVVGNPNVGPLESYGERCAQAAPIFHREGLTSRHDSFYLPALTRHNPVVRIRPKHLSNHDPLLSPIRGLDLGCCGRYDEKEGPGVTITLGRRVISSTLGTTLHCLHCPPTPGPRSPGIRFTHPTRDQPAAIQPAPSSQVGSGALPHPSSHSSRRIAKRYSSWNCPLRYNACRRQPS